MIALITSTLFPPEKSIFGTPRTAFSPQERIEQTAKTIASLKQAGIDVIYLADNSDRSFHEQIHGLFSDIQILTFDDYQFNNRGVNEAILLLNSLKYLPEDQEILKISGRYRLNRHFTKPDQIYSDFIFRGYNYHNKNGVVSTRCYFAKNRQILEQVLLRTLNVMYIYPTKLKGPRSFINIVRRLFKSEVFAETSISIEMAMALTLKMMTCKVDLVEKMGLEGNIAGAATREFICE